MLDPLIFRTISLGLGMMFLVAAYHKLTGVQQFQVTLLQYKILPDSLASIASRTVPILEMLLAAGWLLSFFRQSPGIVAIASAVLLSSYTLAIGINLYRGRVHIDCGCGFGGKGSAEQFLSGGLVMRNLVLISICVMALIPSGERLLGFGDYIVVIVALLTVTLLFAAANQLIANRASMNTWRKRRD